MGPPEKMKVQAYGGGGRLPDRIRTTGYLRSVDASGARPVGMLKLAVSMHVLKPIYATAIPATASHFFFTGIYHVCSARPPRLPALLTHGSASRGSGHCQLATGCADTRPNLTVAVVHDHSQPHLVEEVR
jgi:hypothetical protein